MIRQVKNLVNGKWINSKANFIIPNVLTGKPNFYVPETNVNELKPFVDSLSKIPKSGLHNPFKNPERYNMLGDVCFKTANDLHQKEIQEDIINSIISVTGKSYQQAYGELVVSRRFLENFSGDQVRFTAKGFNVSGDHFGQMSNGFRWPYGPVAIIAPFNFPLEIPLLQLMGALFMGNKPLLKVDSKVAIVMESIIKLLHKNGLPMNDVDFINCQGDIMNELLIRSNPRMTQFTGSSRVANKLCSDLNGKIKIEDAGFDWKIIGPKDNLCFDTICKISTNDAYQFSGQKCSAQSILFIHESWEIDLFKKKLSELAENIKMGPIITWDTKSITNHIDQVLKIDGAELWFGNEKLSQGNIPIQYGHIKPTAIYIPLDKINDSNFDIITKEIFGPVQIISSYKNVDDVLNLCEKMEEHLTGAIVSNNPNFTNYVLGKTVNGTTYVGQNARTTGAPQNHWFGPAGDPRGAGIGTPEAIIQTWSCHREIIRDE